MNVRSGDARRPRLVFRVQEVVGRGPDGIVVRADVAEDAMPVRLAVGDLVELRSADGDSVQTNVTGIQRHVNPDGTRAVEVILPAGVPAGAIGVRSEFWILESLGHLRRGERGRERAAKDALITNLTCAACGNPMPGYRRTCRHCGAAR